VVDVDGYEVYWHGGFWGTVATYTPELELTVAATVNQRHSRALIEELVEKVVRLAAATRSCRTALPAAGSAGGRAGG
jgi:CubicO group peptidase (beta-lactamase class C family)